MTNEKNPFLESRALQLHLGRDHGILRTVEDLMKLREVLDALRDSLGAVEVLTVDITPLAVTVPQTVPLNPVGPIVLPPSAVNIFSTDMTTTGPGPTTVPNTAGKIWAYAPPATSRRCESRPYLLSVTMRGT